MTAAAQEEDQEGARYAQPPIDPDGVRFSRLKLMAESPLHYLANVQGDSAALDKGTAVHSILLGGKRVVYYDGKVKPTKENPNPTKIGPRSGEQWERFKADHANDTILSQSEYDTAHRIADAVRSNDLAMSVLNGKAEDTIRFQYLALPCRTTPDVRALDGSYFTELKTCRSANPFRFASQARWMYYHAQMAFHREGMRRAGMWASKDAPPIPYVVAVGSAAPHPVTVFRVTDKTMELGDRMLRLWFEQLKTCLASRQFPAYAQSVVDLEIEEAEIEISGETYTAAEMPPGW